jgi:hypothetical protein
VLPESKGSGFLFLTAGISTKQKDVFLGAVLTRMYKLGFMAVESGRVKLKAFCPDD